MKPLIILLLSFLAGALLSKLITGSWNLPFYGSLSMCIMLCFTAIGHFIYIDGMSMMLPEVVPFKKEIVYITGAVEILLGIGLLFPQYRHMSAILIIIFFLLVLPANISAALRNVDYENATYHGVGVAYLWFRIPLQLLFIGWVAFFSIRKIG